MKFKNYKNPYNNDNRIFSDSDLLNMSLRELFSRKHEIAAQNRVLGLPNEKELRGSSNVVHVSAYTRDDGTEVKAHWRSKPGNGSSEHNKNIDSDSQYDNNSDIKMSEEEKQEYIKKENEKSIERNDPEEIAGVKRGKPMSKQDAGGKNVNPNYNSDDEGYKSNCTSCIPVHKAREMGYDIEALPAKQQEDGEVKMLRKFPYYAFESYDNEKIEAPKVFRSNNAQECIQTLEQSVKQGECYEFWYQAPEAPDGLAHVVEISKNEQNNLEIYDPQNGKTYGKDYLENIKYTKFKNNIKNYYPQYIFRIDDKRLNYKLLNKISRPSQRKSQ